jgi:hypothetical protein
MTVRELGARMDSAELSEWLAYNRVDPLPDSWTETGVVASTLANLLGGGKKAYRPDDFIPKGRPPRRLPSARQQMALFDRIVARRDGSGPRK